MTPSSTVPATPGAPPPTPHDAACRVCGAMPDRSRDFTKGGETLIATVPPSAGKLDIVGAPFYNQDTSGSNWCLLHCPACGTYYDWDYEYEYLVNGSEDDITISRLTPEEGARKSATVAQYVAEARARFAAEAPPRVEILLHSCDPKDLREAADWAFHAVNRGNDPGPILADLLAAMLRDQVHEDGCTMLNLAFFTYGSRSRENLERLRAAAAAAGAKAEAMLGSTLRGCASLLQGRQ
jgi:hypothetical protein